MGIDLGEHPPNTLRAPSHHTDADELNIGVVRAEGVGGCAREEGIVLGCGHVGNGQEAAMDTTLVVCVLCVPGEEVWQGLREGDWGWGIKVRAGLLPGWAWAHLGSWRSRGTPFLVQVKTILGTPRARQWRVAELVLSPAAATLVRGEGCSTWGATRGVGVQHEVYGRTRYVDLVAGVEVRALVVTHI